MLRKPRPCAVCPVWSANWCAHLAKVMLPDAPSCEWGRKKMNAEYSAEYMRRKFGWTKRAQKAPPQDDATCT